MAPRPRAAADPKGWGRNIGISSETRAVSTFMRAAYGSLLIWFNGEDQTQSILVEFNLAERGSSSIKGYCASQQNGSLDFRCRSASIGHSYTLPPRGIVCV
jgi:hypothetical protein